MRNTYGPATTLKSQTSEVNNNAMLQCREFLGSCHSYGCFFFFIFNQPPSPDQIQLLGYRVGWISSFTANNLIKVAFIRWKELVACSFFSRSLIAADWLCTFNATSQFYCGVTWNKSWLCFYCCPQERHLMTKDHTSRTVCPVNVTASRCKYSTLSVSH